jgi:hypothetical protein
MTRQILSDDPPTLSLVSAAPFVNLHVQRKYARRACELLAPLGVAYAEYRPGEFLHVWDYRTARERDALVEALKVARELLSPEDAAKVEARYVEALA